MNKLFNGSVVLLLLWCLVFMMVPSAALADTLSLAPVADGDLTEAPARPPGTPRWQALNTTDGDSGNVRAEGNGWSTDLFQMGDSSPAGRINSVTVYFKARALSTANETGARSALKTYGTVYYGPEQTLTTSYADFSAVYTTNPNTGAAWTWAEVNDLQAGVALKRSHSPPAADRESRCTRSGLSWTIPIATFLPGGGRP